MTAHDPVKYLLTPHQHSRGATESGVNIFWGVGLAVSGSGEGGRPLGNIPSGDSPDDDTRGSLTGWGALMCAGGIFLHANLRRVLRGVYSPAPVELAVIDRPHTKPAPL